MAIVKEFKEFISRGNVIDLAVGVIIGAAFGKIVDSLVNQVIMPPIGLLLGKVDFRDLKLVLQPENKPTNTAEVAILYGSFLNAVVSFLIVAAAVFVLVKVVNSLKRKEVEAPAAPAVPPRTEVLLEEIRDALKSK